MNFCIIMWLRVYGGREYGAFYENGPCRLTGSGMDYGHVALLKSVWLVESVSLGVGIEVSNAQATPIVYLSSCYPLIRV